jgi:hypothetical protein
VYEECNVEGSLDCRRIVTPSPIGVYPRPYADEILAWHWGKKFELHTGRQTQLRCASMRLFLFV